MPTGQYTRKPRGKGTYKHHNTTRTITWINRNCPTCGVDFKTVDKRQIFCSLKCRRRPVRIWPQLECPHCHRQFTPTKDQRHRIKTQGYVYCSLECFGAVRYQKQDELERFIRYTDQNGPVPEKCPERGPCWLWTGARNKGGYGSFNTGKHSTHQAHIWAHEHFRGPVHKGNDLHHVCETPACVNPWHTDPMTRREHKRQHLSPYCKHGHSFTPENTYHTKDGARVCIECRRAGQKDAYRRKQRTK